MENVQQEKEQIQTITPWYSDPTLKRDRSEILSATPPSKAATSQSSRFILFHGKKGVFYLKNTSSSKKDAVDPLFLTFKDLIKIFGETKMNDIVKEGIDEENNKKEETILAWVGNQNNLDYWALYLPEDDDSSNFLSEEILSNLLLEGNPETKFEDLSLSTTGQTKLIKSLPLREIGDTLSSPNDAAILSTANGLLEFHKSHPFCSKCGSKTMVAKAGASRRCSNSSCTAKSTYPRIDIAAIMLITSPCEQYALLGRKQSWPKGRYSTLAGFAEVGETLEECCVRETYEESGVAVDPTSVRFVLSQPWPFPRSLMVGFRAKAKKDPMGEPDELPAINRCEEEMEDVAWFHRDYVAARIEGSGSTALTYKPSEEEAEFHIPGKASLARILISQWAKE